MGEMRSFTKFEKCAAMRPLEKLKNGKNALVQKKMKNAQQCTHWKKKKTKNQKCAAMRPLEKIE